eukprot:2746794-Rhodomonas_salina.1
MLIVSSRNSALRRKTLTVVTSANPLFHQYCACMGLVSRQNQSITFHMHTTIGAHDFFENCVYCVLPRMSRAGDTNAPQTFRGPRRGALLRLCDVLGGKQGSLCTVKLTQ